MAKKKQSRGRGIGVRVNAVRAGVRAVGVDRVKPGAIRLGETRRLTPTHAGFRTLDAFLLSVQRGTKRGERELYSYDLRLRYRGPDGEFVNAPAKTGSLFPLAADARARRKRGESVAGAMRRLTENAIKQAIFNAVSDVKDIRGNTDSLMRRMAGKSKKKVRAALRKFKSDRGLTFKIVINRVIPGGR